MRVTSRPTSNIMGMNTTHFGHEGSEEDGLRVLFSGLYAGSLRQTKVHWYEHIGLPGASRKDEGKRSTHIENH